MATKMAFSDNGEYLGTKNRARRIGGYGVEPEDVRMLTKQVAKFVHKYGLAELNLRVNAITRPYKVMMKTQRKLVAAEYAMQRAEMRFKRITENLTRDVWEEDTD